MKEVNPIWKIKTEKKRPKRVKQVSEERKALLPLLEELRVKCLEKAGYRCEGQKYVAHKCKGGLEADHIENRSTHPEKITDENNYQCLCWAIHVVKKLEIRAAKIVGLYGNRQRLLLAPFTEEEYADAVATIQRAIERL